ncbi:BnaC09g29490D [Brassica napus]|uniref:BnaC09g29490D protein n=2 Tax=Brassica TaxID=3705 RepID=A0A078G4S0_BRANA|nr:BnaC09g29490D [Brassica napus]VDD31850.1 unnamed protein product [Brassica oleracea]
MPLWVDLENVPGYLYSKKGLTFLSHTAGKFVKLHPTTERCVRLDVARVLVEVDLGKPLPQKICFKGKDGNEVTVGVKFPWLPPCCNVFSKWGHNEKDCHVEREVVILKKPQVEEQQIIVTEGKKEVVSGSGKKVVTELLNELENFSVKATLEGDVSNTGKALRLFLNNLSSGTEYEKWVTLGDQGHRQTSPPREKQAPEEEVPKLRNEVDEAGLDEATNGDDRVGRKKAGQGAGYREKGRGRAVFANSRGLVNAVANSRRCLVETRVQEESFQKVFSDTFPGWHYLHNYSHHRLGRILVCWSDDVEIVPVMVSAQMITVWVRFKDTTEVFLASFIYGSNFPVERLELWREMDLICRSVVGGTNPWILQGDFNVTRSAMEHSRFHDSVGENLAIREFQDIIRSCDLDDISYMGPEFTWINNRDASPTSKKLDRVMGNSSWITTFGQSHTVFEAGGVSDHSRIGEPSLEFQCPALSLSNNSEEVAGKIKEPKVRADKAK